MEGEIKFPLPTSARNMNTKNTSNWCKMFMKLRKWCKLCLILALKYLDYEDEKFEAVLRLSCRDVAMTWLVARY